MHTPHFSHSLCVLVSVCLSFCLSVCMCVQLISHPCTRYYPLSCLTARRTCVWPTDRTGPCTLWALRPTFPFWTPVSPRTPSSPSAPERGEAVRDASTPGDNHNQITSFKKIIVAASENWPQVSFNHQVVLTFTKSLPLWLPVDL